VVVVAWMVALLGLAVTKIRVVMMRVMAAVVVRW